MGISGQADRETFPTCTHTHTHTHRGHVQIHNPVIYQAEKESRLYLFGHMPSKTLLLSMLEKQLKRGRRRMKIVKLPMSQMPSDLRFAVTMLDGDV